MIKFDDKLIKYFLLKDWTYEYKLCCCAVNPSNYPTGTPTHNPRIIYVGKPTVPRRPYVGFEHIVPRNTWCYTHCPRSDTRI